MPTETLLIRIIADSSAFHRELDAAAARLGEFQAQLERFAATQRRLGDAIAHLATQAQPLQAVSASLAQIGRQIDSLSRTPIVLNVTPALQALALLAVSIESVAARLRSLSVVSLPIPLPTPTVPALRMAAGGLVTGPPGLDRIPAFLSEGEFVLHDRAVRDLGLNFLNTLNQPRPAAVPLPSSRPAAGDSIVNHLGGVTLNVRSAVEMNAILRDLRHAGFRHRNRRG